MVDPHAVELCTAGTRGIRWQADPHRRRGQRAEERKRRGSFTARPSCPPSCDAARMEASTRTRTFSSHPHRRRPPPPHFPCPVTPLPAAAQPPLARIFRAVYEPTPVGL